MSDECRFDSVGYCETHGDTSSANRNLWYRSALCTHAAAALRARLTHYQELEEDNCNEMDRLIAICDAIGVRDLAGVEVLGAQRAALEDRVRELEAAHDTVTRSNAELIREIDRAEATVGRMREALEITSDDCGRIMHESWTKTKRTQGFHHPNELSHDVTSAPCPRCHADLVDWDELPERQKDINRHAFDNVLGEIRRRAALAAAGEPNVLKLAQEIADQYDADLRRLA